ncbi:NYN domain-containing protein [Halomonas korlensis]|uniref:NYN domain-containing protein n=1 Tax=Halomonas korlensis TaxID=463301 RepID=A0A1I7HVT5_9GAMM|nr:NYN domain-containing protein [Halomonas korlensis]SFU64835.1 NYN domain-containing protein [Halomonas korlensis]
MPTAILVDGGYFIKRFRRIEPDNAYDGQRAAECLHRWAVMHLNDGNGKRSRQGIHRRELYRIFFYDCPPLAKKMHNPITKKAIDFSQTTEARFREELHSVLLSKRKLALRLGHLSDDAQWTIKPQVIRQLLKGKMALDDLQESDVQVDTRQKGVDMRIGVDVTSLTLKKQVDQVVLIAGDADFVPAAKIARREGIDFVLDPMWQKIPPGLHEHIDGLRTTCPRPKPVEKAKQ